VSGSVNFCPPGSGLASSSGRSSPRRTRDRFAREIRETASRSRYPRKMPARIAVDREKIADFCRRNHIRRLALFGSVLRLLAMLRKMAAKQGKPYQTLIHELLEKAASRAA